MMLSADGCIKSVKIYKNLEKFSPDDGSAEPKRYSVD